MLLNVAEWFWMMLNNAEWWLLIKQEPHDRSVLFIKLLLHRLAYVRHAPGLMTAGSNPLYVVVIVVFVMYVINRNLIWTYAHILKGTHLHRMPKGIFCMAKNLTEVIENIELHQRKEFYVVTEYSIASVMLSKGKLLLYLTFFIFNLIAISCLLLSLKSR